MNIKKISDIKLDKLYIKYRDSTDPQEKLISQLAQSVIWERERANVWKSESLAAGKFEEKISKALGINPPFHEEYYGMGKYWLKHVLARIKELRK